ncbi:SLAM family member 5-like isoform X2 [Phyllostomus hastatus]|uniref:SLAM family member 5-like isoform X2 n=1 Tax=Phyllostomus hastatus TaxID=9423 RepID=UPI001E682ECE|nr:SLAM family member 5-like isoform X2 [Phyllostomus hastatus]
MQTCSEDTHPLWFFCVLGFTSILLGIYSPGAMSSETHVSEIKDSRAPVFLTRIQGESVLFNVIQEPGTKLEEISWSIGPESNYRVMLEVKGQVNKPNWLSLQDKYMQRAHILNRTSLRIENLTHDDSGQYRARVRFPGGKEFSQVFYLTVYEPVPLPQILVKSQSITSDWCNITLECTPIRATQDLNVTWRSSGPPRELDETSTLEPALISWSLPMKLPLTQTNISLACVVSNPVDQKNATTNLGEVCDHHSHGQTAVGPLRGIARAVVPVLLTVGAGLYFLMTCGKKKEKMETRRGAGLEEHHQDHNDDIYYAELTEQESQEGRDKGISEQHLEEKELLNSIYDEVHKPGQARP